MTFSTLKMVLDQHGNPHVIWSDIDEIHYFKWIDSEWVTADGMSYSHDSKSKSLIKEEVKISGADFVLDSNDNPHIVWSSDLLDNTSSTGERDERIKYIRWDGKNWVTADGKRY